MIPVRDPTSEMWPNDKKPFNNLHTNKPFDLSLTEHKSSDDQLHQRCISSSISIWLSLEQEKSTPPHKTFHNAHVPCTCPEVDDSLVQILLMSPESALFLVAGSTCTCNMITRNRHRHLKISRDCQINLVNNLTPHEPVHSSVIRAVPSLPGISEILRSYLLGPFPSHACHAGYSLAQVHDKLNVSYFFSVLVVMGPSFGTETLTPLTCIF